jgi:hypothetical protein
MDKHNTTEQPSITDSGVWSKSERDTASHSVQRRTHHNRKTLTRIVMDEVDFHREYYKILDVVKEMEDGLTKKSMMLMLQLMQGLLEMIIEMQVEEDDE